MRISRVLVFRAVRLAVIVGFIGFGSHAWGSEHAPGDCFAMKAVPVHGQRLSCIFSSHDRSAIVHTPQDARRTLGRWRMVFVRRILAKVASLSGREIGKSEEEQLVDEMVRNLTLTASERVDEFAHTGQGYLLVNAAYTYRPSDWSQLQGLLQRAPRVPDETGSVALQRSSTSARTAPKPAAQTMHPVPDSTSRNTKTVSHAGDWLHQDNGARYTVQLLATTEPGEIHRVVEEYGLGDSADSFVQTVDGRRYYTLVVGQFEHAQQARAFVKGLAKGLQQNGPWVRSLSDIRQHMESWKP